MRLCDDIQAARKRAEARLCTARQMFHRCADVYREYVKLEKDCRKWRFKLTELNGLCSNMHSEVKIRRTKQFREYNRCMVLYNEANIEYQLALQRENSLTTIVSETAIWLPDEIVAMILFQASNPRVGAVCRQWRRVVKTSPRVFHMNTRHMLLSAGQKCDIECTDIFTAHGDKFFARWKTATRLFCGNTMTLKESWHTRRRVTSICVRADKSVAVAECGVFQEYMDVTNIVECRMHDEDVLVVIHSNGTSIVGEKTYHLPDLHFTHIASNGRQLALVYDNVLYIGSLVRGRVVMGNGYAPRRQVIVTCVGWHTNVPIIGTAKGDLFVLVFEGLKQIPSPIPNTDIQNIISMSWKSGEVLMHRLCICYYKTIVSWVH